MWPDCARDPEGLALLRAAVAHPHDETPRLVLADWLQEQGEEEVAGVLRRSLIDGWDCLPLLTWFPDGTRERWAPWDGSWYGWLGIQRDNPQVPAADVLDPEWVTVYGASNCLHTVLPHLYRFTNLIALDLAGSMCSFNDDSLATLPSLPNLTVLNLSLTDITDAGLRHLTRFPKLAYLGLVDSPGPVSMGPYLTKQAVEEFRAMRPNCRIEW